MKKSEIQRRCRKFSLAWAAAVVAAIYVTSGLSAHAQQYNWSTFAGMPGGSGFLDGTGSNAQFNSPSGVAVDAAGNVYVADAGNNTIRKMTPAGMVTTLAGSVGYPGSADGSGTNSQFNSPSGVALDAAGNIYVADAGNETIRKVTPSGVVTTLAGTAGQFSCPTGVAVDSSSNVYVADCGFNMIFKVTPAGMVTTLAGSAGNPGFADGTGTNAQFSYPTGVAVDTSGNVYVADSGNDTIRKVTPAGMVTTLAGNPVTAAGSADGTGTNAQFNSPSRVAVDAAGNVYVVDTGNYTIRKVTLGGVVTTLAGTAGNGGSADGTGTEAQFNFFNTGGYGGGIAVAPNGNLYVADSGNDTIREIAAGAVTTLAGCAPHPGSADGIGTAARFDCPAGIAMDSSSNIYVADGVNNTVRKVTPAGIVTTLAGSAGNPGFADGTGTNAQFRFSYGSPVAGGVAVDADGNIYVADSENNAIRKVTSAGVVTTLAGGSQGSADGNGANAQFNYPTAVAVDSSSNVYVADSLNNAIRKITPAGVVTTLAGGSQGSADGDGTNAQFNFCYDSGYGSDYNGGAVAVDSGGYVYVADSGNNTIRKITPIGIVTTLAGIAGSSGSADGAGSAARFNLFNVTLLNQASLNQEEIIGCWGGGIAVDSSSNIYVADAGNNMIRKITPAGAVSTVGGTAGVTGWADGAGAAAQFNGLNGIAVDAAGNLYVADSNNNRISQGTVAEPAGPQYTVNAAVISANSVTLSATVNPNGFAGPTNNRANVLAYWQYGLVSGSYTQTTTPQPVGTGTFWKTVSFSHAKKGFSASIYHYCLAISSTLGTVYSPDQTFSLAPPTVVAGTPAVTGSGATISTAIDPNLLDTTVALEYGLTTSNWSIAGTQDIGSGSASVEVSATLTGLAPNTLYYYRIVTTNALGTIYGPVQMLATQPLFGTTALVSVSDPAPGIAGATFRELGNPAINDSDHVAFQALVTGSRGSGINAANDSGIWADIGSNGRALIAQTGSSAPGYTPGSAVGTFATLSDPVFANDDVVAFLGKLVNKGGVKTTNDIGIWTTTSGTLALMARTGDPAPDANGAVSGTSPLFASFTQFVLPNQGGVVVLASLEVGKNRVVSSNKEGIWAVNTSGVLTCIIRTGDALSVNGSAKVVSDLTIFNAPATTTGQTRHFNNPGDLLYKVTFKDGSTSIVQSVFP